MKEIWKDIVGYEGYYQVSNYGNARSLDRYVASKNRFTDYEMLIKGQLLKPQKSKIGYLQILFRKNKKYKGFLVHRLVAEAFIPNLNNHPQINHIDEDKWNNYASNLEWCDAKYNTNYGNGIKKRLDAKAIPIFQLKDGSVIKKWRSIREAGRNGFSDKCIGLCCKKIYKQHKGYQWQYA